LERRIETEIAARMDGLLEPDKTQTGTPEPAAATGGPADPKTPDFKTPDSKPVSPEATAADPAPRAEKKDEPGKLCLVIPALAWPGAPPLAL
ncbi:MAG: hypothetical protein IT565_11345, partial [Rhodospirillales bacterium]|nr:hypothetical protein [Rhodospirillales bacterium]